MIGAQRCYARSQGRSGLVTLSISDYLRCSRWSIAWPKLPSGICLRQVLSLLVRFGLPCHQQSRTPVQTFSCRPKFSQQPLDQQCGSAKHVIMDRQPDLHLTHFCLDLFLHCRLRTNPISITLLKCCNLVFIWRCKPITDGRYDLTSPCNVTTLPCIPALTLALSGTDVHS